MKIKWKLTIYSTVWLTFILIIFNVLLYFSFIRVSTESEIALLYNKADTILSQRGVKGIQDGNQLREDLLKNEIIRVLDVNGKIIAQAFNQWNLSEYPPAPAQVRQNEVVHTGGQTIVFVHVPIFNAGKQFGTIEIGRSLTTMDAYVQTLSSIQFGTTLLSILLSLGGGYVFSHLALQPISHIIQTIKGIHVLGLSRRLELPAHSKDEIYELSVTFNKMLDRIEAAFQTQRRFLADASHELRTPLTIIESYANLLNRWGTKDPEIQAEAIREIQSEARRLKDLTESLLDLSSIDKEQTENATEMDLVSFIKESLEPFKQVYRRTIRFHCVSKHVYFKMSKRRLKQLLVIFLDNAMKYSEKEVDIWLKDMPEAVEIGIKDKGIGIPKEDLPHVFDRFYRVDKVRNRETGGKGLGLSIAHSIVEKYGGNIQIHSDSGKGTEIVVYLPRDQNEKKRV